MRNRLYIALFLLCCFSCNNDKDVKSTPLERGEEAEIQFDKSKWSSKEDLDYPYRDQMLNDLLYNDTVRSLSKDETLYLLGEPDRINDGYHYYMIAQKRLGSWPLHTKSLVIKFSNDSTIAWIKIHE